MIYFIVNKSSRTGKGLDVWLSARRILKEKNVKYRAFSTKYKGHATELARKISGLTTDEIKLVVVGGDGTINEVINGISDFNRVCLGVIPTGSGNDYAGGLGLNGDTEYYVNKIIESSDTSAIDLGRVSWDGCSSPRYFAISSGLGMDAIVCKKALTSKLKVLLNRLRMGKLTYLLLTIQTLFSMETVKAAAAFDSEKVRKYDKLIFSAAMNFKAEGGGVPMAPAADARDGRLSMCFAYGVPRWKAFFLLPFLVAAKHEGLKYFHLRDCMECHIRIEKPVVLHADGEYLGDVKNVRFECVKGLLKVMI